eukprot:scaffold288766_cov33-Tisochrysis_lutea.AAC.1
MVLTLLRCLVQARILHAETIDAVLARRTTTSLKVQLAAPRLILPYDLADPTSSVLVIDMGAMDLSSVVQSTRYQVAPLDEGDAPKTQLGRESGTDELGRLYDSYTLRSTSMEVLVIPSGVSWRRPDFVAQRSWYPVYQLGLEVEVLHCILPPGTHNFSDMLVSGSLSEADAPAVHLRLSQEQLQVMSTILGRVLELRHEAVEFDAEPSVSGTSPDSHGSDGPSSTLRLQAKISIQSVSLLLEDEDGDDLVELRSTGIVLNAQQQPSERRLTFDVGRFEVEDRRHGPTAQSARLVDSRGEDAVWGAADSRIPFEDGPLVHLEYSSSKTYAPDELHVRFNELHLQWNPRTVAKLSQFGHVTQRPESLPTVFVTQDGFGTAPPHPPCEHEALLGVENLAAKNDAERGAGLRVLVRLEALSVRLNREELG